MEKRDLTFSTRCREDEFFICKGFISQEPGQIEIIQHSVQPQKLEKGEKIIVRAKLENSGKTDIIEVKGSVTLFKEIQTEREIIKEEKRKIHFERFPLYLGQGIEVEKEIEITEAGEYLVELYFEESIDMTDFALKTERIFVSETAVQGECLPGTKEFIWDADPELCAIQMECLDCLDLNKCMRSWEGQIPSLSGKEFGQSGFNTGEKKVKISVAGGVQGAECVPV